MIKIKGRKAEILIQIDLNSARVGIDGDNKSMNCEM